MLLVVAGLFGVRIGGFALATGTAAVLAFFDRSLRGPSGPARRAVPADH